MSDFDPRVEEIEILIATDVTNPLTGNNGASYVFGPQREQLRKWSKYWMKT